MEAQLEKLIASHFQHFVSEFVAAVVTTGAAVVVVTVVKKYLSPGASNVSLTKPTVFSLATALAAAAASAAALSSNKSAMSSYKSS